MRLQQIADHRHVVLLVADPRVPKKGWLARLEDLALDNPTPAEYRLRDELEPRSDCGRETHGPAALARRGPQRDEHRVGQAAPDLRGGMGILIDDVEAAHGHLVLMGSRRGLS